ncbi:hypothetical protein LZU96_23100 (plasmid) [Pantoea agglomerans]|uniref:hypothetical protein n=1 Tax=Enterobacter agglomerans TaxID=549 RepID=UPI001F28F33A|nr:hypothetical protein [Pantoea agglomerans]UIL55052.1 hypothetical protein LZU96_23100 [Pantoea agglomerans]
MPPLAGMALHDVSLSLLLLNVAVFFTGVQLVRQTWSDMSVLNVLVTGKPD